MMNDVKVKRLSVIAKGISDLGWDNTSLCYGHFNVIHPGHLRYFQTARNYGDRLVVALEGDSQLSESDRRQLFSEEERAQSVAALDLIDSVVILDCGDLETLIRLIKPSSLVLGREFERERSDEVSGAIKRTSDQGGSVVYDVGETHYATAQLFQGSQLEIEAKRWQQFQSALDSHEINLKALIGRLSKESSPNILVIGDTIVDRYVACDPVGLSNEAPVVVVKEIDSRDFIGGAAIVAGHVAALGGRCTYLSVVGDDEHAVFVENKLSNLGINVNLLQDKSRPTTFKIRYIVENQKLFRVSQLKEHSLSSSLENQVVDVIQQYGASLDAIVLSDFVYGVITPRIIDTVSQLSKQHDILLAGDVQCSSQIGDVSKFKNFALLCPTEREARLALNNQDDGIEYVSNLLMENTRANNLVIKLGGEGLIAYGKTNQSEFINRQHFPAITANPVDVAGAGDSLLAGMVVALASRFSVMEAAALGSCIASIAVQTVGNNPVHIDDLEMFINSRMEESSAD